MVTFRAALVHFVYQFRPATRRNHKRRKRRIERKKKDELNGRKRRIERKKKDELNGRKRRIERKKKDELNGRKATNVRYTFSERSFHPQRTLVSIATKARFHRNEGSLQSNG